MTKRSNDNPGIRVAFAKRVELVTKMPNVITLRELDDLVRNLKRYGFMPGSQIELSLIANGIYRFEAIREDAQEPEAEPTASGE